MAEITASMVKQLRETTGAGMMDCKSALTETGGDMEAAIDWLRTKGLAKAAKKAGRVAAEGLIGVVAKGTAGAIVEVNSETDFVARNEQFQKMVSDVASAALSVEGDFDKLVASSYPGSSKSVKDYVTEMVGTIGENMNVRRAGYISVDDGAVAAYVHSQVVPGLGKIGVLVGLESKGDKAKLLELGRQIAMHIAATNPLATRKEDMDPALVERERNVLIAEARESGRPENIIEKMVEGRIRKFYEEVVLLSQAFVINPDDTVEKAVKAAEADVGAPITVVGFLRFALGEGIEKEESDFAAEVAAAARG
ncbi:translation elongation factor Ts [Parvibaculum sp.]|uniref:translation elongation factor Ts n=1 Tax=Parvibaculum sp. TaxID=2024848 RepID=UPI002730E11B|nr:translation elongation factor Ts [Parvibaculum sp.]MDP1627940.1 translation elongation factor Ts [Parvibaculum sp.]MDP2150938.1 translation elongation factor Ts [Parvibaculum sp.]MDP3327453.1 translation elongation factor Ts [Parvibaculum sp.]